MKSTNKQLTLILAFAISAMFQLNARILTVSNQTSPQVAEFNTIQAAHDAAQSGDTIYVYPCLSSFKGAKISKNLTLIGNGFNKVNDYTDCSKITTSDTLYLNSGSEGSIISSVVGNFKIRISTSNILIQRCKLSKIIIDNNLSTISIINCIITTNTDQNAVRVLNNTSAINVQNNIIIQNGYYQNQGTEDISTFYVGNNSSMIIKNNIVRGYHITYSLYANSIYISDNIFYNAYGGWDRWHNLSPNAILKNGTFYCEQNTDSRWISFVDINHSDYHLNSNSPAKNIGTDNQDLGIYTGTYPFIDDGAPSLPTIYSLTIPATASQKDGLPIVLKAKTNN